MTLSARFRRIAVRSSKPLRRWRPRPTGVPEPPTCPPGWRIGPPDFIGIGAQKAGTSWWSALLHLHPDVSRSGGRPKELHFFDQFWERAWADDQADQYARYFPRPEGAAAGEWTPAYMVDFWTPDLIARAAPDARLLALLRDPIDRFRSGVTHTKTGSRTALEARDAHGAFRRGLYAQQLRRVFDALPRERVLVLQYEACRGDPARWLTHTFRFLGLRDIKIDPAHFTREVNPTTSRKVDLTPHERDALASAYADDLDELAALLPDLDLSLWPTAAQTSR
jgi:hypothetical protein